MKKIFTVLVVALGIAFPVLATPSGPYYVILTSGSTCNKLKLYLDGVSIYGASLTCDGSRSSLYITGVGGYYDPSTSKVVVSRYWDTGSVGTLRSGMIEVIQINLLNNTATKTMTSDVGDTSTTNTGNTNTPGFNNTPRVTAATWSFSQN